MAKYFGLSLDHGLKKCFSHSFHNNGFSFNGFLQCHSNSANLAFSITNTFSYIYLTLIILPIPLSGKKTLRETWALLRYHVEQSDRYFLTFLDFLTLVNGTDSLSRNVGKELTFYVA